MRQKVGTEVVKQSDLRSILDLRDSLRAAEERAAALAKEVRAREAAAISALVRGARVEPGRLSAAVAESTRRVVRWKEAFVLRLGEAEAQSVLESTPPTIYRSLEISGEGR